MDLQSHILHTDDSNIDVLRQKYGEGLHFVVGDTHGDADTLFLLMQKIHFDPMKDHVYFVGDYNSGRDVRKLVQYLAVYYQPDYEKPGFHLIRGNHERELGPMYALENLPDIIVLRTKAMQYYICHAGMVREGFALISEDIAAHPEQHIFAYQLDNISGNKYGPLGQITWSRYGLYAPHVPQHNWPDQESLHQNRACILHGHTPFSYFIHRSYFGYGRENLFWENQHIFFSEDLQGFDLDADIKGRNKNGQTYRGLACVCLEATDEIATLGSGMLTVEHVRNAENFVFGEAMSYKNDPIPQADTGIITEARPIWRGITVNEEKKPIFR